VQGRHKEAATSISTFITSTVTDLLTTGIFHLATPAIAFHFVRGPLHYSAIY